MKWKGDMKTSGFSIPVNITLKMLDETTLGDWRGRGLMINNPDAQRWMLENKGKVLETDIGSIVIQSYKAKPDGQLLVRFICAGLPQGKLAQDIKWVK